MVILYKTNPTKKSSILLLLTLFFSMLDLHGFLVSTRTSSLMSKKRVLIGCVMVHGIILKKSHSCMDINFKISSILEENTDTILCVLLTHKTSSTLQQDMTILAVVTEDIFQVIHQHRLLHPLVIHYTLSNNGFNASSPTTILELQCTMITCESSPKKFLSIFHKNSLITTKNYQT